MPHWALDDARSRFSAVVDAALAGEPQHVIPSGKPAVVVLSMKEYERLRNQPKENAPSFIDHLLAIPTDDDDFEFERMPLSSRSLEL